MKTSIGEANRWIRHWSARIRGFSKLPSLAMMPILASEAFTTWKQKIPVTKCYPQWVLNCWFQVQHSPFWTNLAFACKTETLGCVYSRALDSNQVQKNQWFMNKSLKISQVANARLTQKGECWTWNQRLIRSPGSILTGSNIFHKNFLFSCSKASDADVGILANSVFKNSIAALRDWLSVVGC